MKIVVMFGSKSDANIYEPLKARLLNEGHEVDFRMISVHRSPELLDRTLAGIDAQAVVAGAGLAAHLPGIVASKLLIPVFGIPCTAAIGGMDAYFAISQMPFGIPVLSTAPDQYQSAVDAIGRWAAWIFSIPSIVSTLCSSGISAASRISRCCSSAPRRSWTRAGCR